MPINQSSVAVLHRITALRWNVSNFLYQAGYLIKLGTKQWCRVLWWYKWNDTPHLTPAYQALLRVLGLSQSSESKSCLHQDLEVWRFSWGREPLLCSPLSTDSSYFPTEKEMFIIIVTATLITISILCIKSLIIPSFQSLYKILKADEGCHFW